MPKSQNGLNRSVLTKFIKEHGKKMGGGGFYGNMPTLTSKPYDSEFLSYQWLICSNFSVKLKENICKIYIKQHFDSQFGGI